jgi:pentatricopeptide repeat protein
MSRIVENETAVDQFKTPVKTTADIISSNVPKSSGNKTASFGFHVDMMKKASALRDFAAFEKAYKSAFNADASNHQYLFNITINLAGECGDIEFARQIYHAAIAAGAVDIATHTAMIKAAGESKNYEHAFEAYGNYLQELGNGTLRPTAHMGEKNPKVIANITHNTMITAMGKCARPDQAWNIFENILGIADEITFTAMIKAAYSNQRMDLAKKAFGIALNDPKIKKCYAVYNAMMSAVAHNGTLPELESVHNLALKELEKLPYDLRSMESAYQKAVKKFELKTISDNRTTALTPLADSLLSSKILTALKQPSSIAVASSSPSALFSSSRKEAAGVVTNSVDSLSNNINNSIIRR